MVFLKAALLNLLVLLVHCSQLEGSDKKPSPVSSSISSLATTEVAQAPLIRSESDADEEALQESDNSLINRLGPLSPGLKRKLSSNTMLINKEFHEEWKNILVGLEILVDEQVVPSQSIIYTFMKPTSEKSAQTLLMEAIRSDNRNTVIRAIANGAKFLSNGSLTRLRTADYAPIEIAVVLDSTDALAGMMQYLSPILSTVKSTLFGGLLIRAVQAGHFKSAKLLVNEYKAPYLKGSFLFQQAIMHKAPLKLLKYILKKFEKISPEVSSSYNRHRDYPLHLAVKYNNEIAFAFLFHEIACDKNILNGDGLRPIDLILKGLKGQYDQFLLRLFTRWPRFRLAWTDELGNNLLHLAVYAQNRDIIQFAVKALHFEIESINANGQTALMIASMIRNRPISAYLIQMGASIFATDAIGIYPILIIARQNDLDAFIYTLDSFISQNIPDVPLLLATLLQTLIYDQLWIFVDVMFTKFPLLSQSPFVITNSHLDNLLNSQLVWDSPALIDYLIKCKIIDPNSILHQAVALGKLEVLKVLISRGAQPGLMNSTGESIMTVAIKNNRPQIVRFLLSLGGWTILDSPSFLDIFVYLITDGASFSPFLPSRILFQTREGVLSHFLNYFKNIKTTLQFNPIVLTTVCIQLELFLFHYVCEKPLTSKVVVVLAEIFSVKKAIYEAFPKQVNLSFPLFTTLLNAVQMKIYSFLRPFIPNLALHVINPEELVPYIDPANVYLIHEYNSILN